MQLAWVALFAFLGLGLFVGPLNDACCLVGPNAPYKSIQVAIDAAPSGSTVVVFSGIYRENLVIDKPLNLINADYTVLFPLLNHNQPLLQAHDNERPAIDIRASNVKIQGFIVRGGSAGIQVSGHQQVRLLNNRISLAQDGILVQDAKEIWIKNNTLSSNTRYGARVVDSTHIRVLANNFDRNERGVILDQTHSSLIKASRFGRHTGYAITLSEAAGNALAANRTLNSGPGILLQDSAHTLMRDNHLTIGSSAFWIETQDLSGYEQDINASNTIGGLPILYFQGLKNRKLKPGLKPGFLALIDAKEVEIANLRVDQMPLGILLVRSQDIRVIDATIRNTRSGIVALQSQNILVTDSTISKSQQYGLHFDHSSNLQVRRTMIFESGEHGLYAVGGSGLKVEASDITDNKGSALWLEEFSDGTLTDNDFSGNDQYGVSLQLVGNLTLRNNLMQGNQTGLHLDHANSNRIQDNQIQKNQFGIFLQTSVDNTLIGNLLTLNVRGGIKGNVENNVVEGNIEDVPQ